MTDVQRAILCGTRFSDVDGRCSPQIVNATKDWQLLNRKQLQ